MKRLTLALALLTALTVSAQTRIDLARQGRTVDFSSASSTRPLKTGVALPATCETGDMFFKTSAPVGENVYGCVATNTWALLGPTPLDISPADTGKILTNDGVETRWRAVSGDVTGAPDALTVSGLRGRALSATAPVNGDVLTWNESGNLWEPVTSMMQAGVGIAITGSVVSADDALIPFYYTGTGTPTIGCVAGRDYYLDSANGELHYCSAANTWIKSARMLAGVGAPSATTCNSAQEVGTFYSRLDASVMGEGLYFCEAAGVSLYGWSALGSGGSGSAGPHALLSASHNDTVAGTVIRGDVITGDADAKWKRLPLGASGNYLRSNGSDAIWSSIAVGDLPTHTHTTADLTTGVVPVTRGGTGVSTPGDDTVLIGNGSTFTAATVPSCSATNEKLLYNVATNSFTCGADQSGGSAVPHGLLSASHDDTVAGTVIRGDVITGDANAKWRRLPLGASGNYLRSNGTDAVWGSIGIGDLPTHTHTTADLTAGVVPVTRGGTGISTPGDDTVLIGDGATFASTTVPACSAASEKLLYDIATNSFTCGSDQSGGAAGPHGLLSGSHDDTVAGAASRGDVITGDANAKWKRLPLGASGNYLRSNGTDAVWGSIGAGDLPTHTHAAADLTAGVVPVTRGGTGVSTPGDDTVLIGDGSTFVSKTVPACSAASEKLLYDVATNSFTCGTDQSGGSAGPHGLLSASHDDTVAGTVIRGDVITGDADAKWKRLPLGASGNYLRSNGTDAVWGSIGAGDLPTHTHAATDLISEVLPVTRGGTGISTAGDDTVLIGNGSTLTAAALPSCSATTEKLLYDVSTNTFTCGSDQGGSSAQTITDYIWFQGGSRDTANEAAQISAATSNGNLIAAIGSIGLAAASYADGANAITSLIHYKLPPTWDNGLAPTLTFVWVPSSGFTSGQSVVWTTETACTTIGESVAPTFNTANIVQSATAASTASTQYEATVNLNMTGCAANELMLVRIGRDPTNAGDNLSATASLIGVQLKVRRNLN